MEKILCKFTEFQNRQLEVDEELMMNCLKKLYQVITLARHRSMMQDHSAQEEGRLVGD